MLEHFEPTTGRKSNVRSGTSCSPPQRPPGCRRQRNSCRAAAADRPSPRCAASPAGCRLRPAEVSSGCWRAPSLSYQTPTVHMIHEMHRQTIAKRIMHRQSTDHGQAIGGMPMSGRIALMLAHEGLQCHSDVSSVWVTYRAPDSGWCCRRRRGGGRLAATAAAAAAVGGAPRQSAVLPASACRPTVHKQISRPCPLPSRSAQYRPEVTHGKEVKADGALRGMVQTKLTLTVASAAVGAGAALGHGAGCDAPRDAAAVGPAFSTSK